MPRASLRPCLHPGCPTLVPRGRCDAHGGPRKAWQPSTPVERLRGAANQARRQRLFRRNPLCVHCQQAGRVRPATIADHIIPLQEGGTDNDANLQGLCAECHRIKTAEEARRGAARAR